MAVSVALFTLANGLYASYRVQRQILIDNTLESNRAYAVKLAAITQNFLDEAHQQLAYSAAMAAGQFGSRERLQREAERLHRQSDNFNSVLFFDASGRVLVTSPETLPLRDQVLNTPGVSEALLERRLLVSQPYVSTLGNLLVFISAPVIDGTGRYLGLVGGTIYLKQQNVLHSLLGEQYYRDGSYLYVVDYTRRLLYHPEITRVGEQIGANHVIDAVLRGQVGQMSARNSQGTDMLAGYAAVPETGWGVVVQRPLHAALAPLDALMLDVLRNTLPLALLTMLFIWWFARLVSLPLQQLADHVRELEQPTVAGYIRGVHSWYFESAELKRALLVGIDLLHQRISQLARDVQLDPLTGLCNRRVSENVLATWQAEQRVFAAVFLDIDWFKQINDTYGHDVGDQVLQHLARLIRECTRDVDVLCRTGGEEFLILLPDITPDAALLIAERLCRQIARDSIDPVGQVTVSLGVAHCPFHASEAGAVLKAADRAMYQAKRSGRNRVAVARTVLHDIA